MCNEAQGADAQVKHQIVVNQVCAPYYCVSVHVQNWCRRWSWVGVLETVLLFAVVKCFCHGCGRGFQVVESDGSKAKVAG